MTTNDPSRAEVEALDIDSDREIALSELPEYIAKLENEIRRLRAPAQAAAPAPCDACPGTGEIVLDRSVGAVMPCPKCGDPAAAPAADAAVRGIADRWLQYLSGAPEIPIAGNVTVANLRHDLERIAALAAAPAAQATGEGKMLALWRDYLSAQDTIEQASFMDNHADAARARVRQSQIIGEARAALLEENGHAD